MTARFGPERGTDGLRLSAAGECGESSLEERSYREHDRSALLRTFLQLVRDGVEVRT